MSGGRCALVGLLFMAGACAQTDVIARDGTSDGGTVAACPSALCNDFEDVAQRCADPSARLSLGDGCSHSDSLRPASRFALCSCTEVVTTHALATDAWDSRSPSRTSSVTSSVGTGGDCACSFGHTLDVAALVAAHAADNDDTALGFLPASLEGFSAQAGDPAVALGCGRYYTGSVHGSGMLRLSVTGHALMFIDGDLSLDDDLEVTLADGAALELFVAGNVRIAGNVTLGDALHAPSARMYVGGAGTIDLGGAAFFGGPLYAPRSELVTRGKLELYGSLFVRRAAPLADVTVHYDAAESAPAACKLKY